MVVCTPGTEASRNPTVLVSPGYARARNADRSTSARVEGACYEFAACLGSPWVLRVSQSRRHRFVLQLAHAG